MPFQSLTRVRRSRSALVVLALLPRLAAADVYRCESGGRWLYTDRPCAAGAAPLAIEAPPTIEAQPGADLARAHDQRLERERGRRQSADRAWLAQHAAETERDTRIHRGLVEGRIVPGMTPAQVRQVRGEPDEVVADPQAGRERWVYRGARTGSGRKGSTTVRFEDGRVAGGAKAAIRPEKPARRQSAKAPDD